MAKTETPVPGWYPDPDDAGQIRYWNGSEWTDKRRPRPAWNKGSKGAAGASGQPAPPASGAMPPSSGGYLRTMRPGQERPKVVWVLAAILAAAAAVIFLLSFQFLKPHNAGPRTITDRNFIQAANQVCKQQLDPLKKADRPQINDSDQIVADRTEAAATGLEHLIASLRQVPVQPADQARVTAWLDAWTTYATTGHQVAAAIRTSNPAKYEPLLEQGRKERFPVADFASANGIKSCSF